METDKAQPLDLDKQFEAAINAAYPIPDTPHTSVMQRANEGRGAFTKGWQAARIAQARAAEVDTTASASIETEISDRLKRVVLNHGEGTIPVQSKLLLQAADECDRFYNGMMNWKANAQAKDRTIIELRAQQAAAQDFLPPLGIHSDRDMLNYLMVAFDNEIGTCERCGHSEPTKKMDSAGFLRDYLAAAPTAGAATTSEDARDAARLDVLESLIERAREQEAKKCAFEFDTESSARDQLDSAIRATQQEGDTKPG